MAGPVSAISQVPLNEVLPPNYSGVEDEVRRLSATLERHQRADGRTGWHWYPTHSTAPQLPGGGIYLVVFDATITLFNNGVDWLELTIDLAWRRPRQLTVNAAVEVACWCPTDHNMHQVRQAQWIVDSSAALIDALAAGTEMLLDVLDSGPYEPSPWRIDATLPDAVGS